jgi:hypothetical protein
MYTCMPYGQIPVHYRQMPEGEDDYLKKLLSKLTGRKVDILLNGREGVFKNLLILRVEDGVVITEAENEICVIPIKFIATVFLAKDFGKKVI